MSQLCLYRGRILLLLFGSMLQLISCSGRDELHIMSGKAQGTTWQIKYLHAKNLNLQKSIDSIFVAIDNSLSTYQEHSIISKINRDETNKTDFHFSNVYRLSKKISETTDGSFDATVGALVNAWGFGLSNRNNIDTTLIDSLLIITGYQKTSLVAKELLLKPKGMILDYNAIAQGYTVDVLSDFLIRNRIENYLIEVGGEVIAKGVNENKIKWRIGIDQPENTTEANRKIRAVISLSGMALATSGNYRKYYIENGKKYSHTINPITGYPVQHNLLSATVIAESCASADAFATAFMVMGLEKSKLFLQNHPEINAYLVYSNENGEYDSWQTEGISELLVELES